MPAKSCLLSARLRPRVPRSARVSGLAIRMTSVLCSSPSAPMLTSLTIQATLPLHQWEYRPENTSSGLAPPISRQSRCGKTTLCAHLAVEAEKQGGGPVSVIDTDPQGSLARWWNARAAETPSFVQTTLPQLPQQLTALQQARCALVARVIHSEG